MRPSEDRMSVPTRPAWTRTAFTALHDLVLDLAEDASPAVLAAEAQRAFRAAMPGVPTAIWWCGDNGAVVIDGTPPGEISKLPAVRPPHLCLLRHGGAYDGSLFGLDGTLPWRFVPITDRTELYGWIGLQTEHVPEESGLLAFLCAAGALLGKAWKWSGKP